jgi:hypothetical protein
MRRQFLERLTDLRPMIKTCWEVLLRAEPPASALGHPDTLVFMMDATLDAFFAAARSRGPRRWLAHHPLLCGTLEETCPCGRNPLLRYYITGEQAVLAIAAKTLSDLADPPCPADEQLLAEVRLTFHYLAQVEVQTFCDLCRGTCARARAGIVTGWRRSPPRLRRQRRLAPPRPLLPWPAALHAR